MGCERGAEILLATFGEKGSLAYDDHLVNTVGAGDSYGSGFMAGIIRGESIEACMERGARKAAEIVSIFEPYHRKGRE